MSNGIIDKKLRMWFNGILPEFRDFYRQKD